MSLFDRRLGESRLVESLLGFGSLVADRPLALLDAARRQILTYLPIAAVIAGALSLLLLVQTSTQTAEGYTLRTLEDQRNDWQQKNLQLEAEIAALQSLRRVDILARQRLGMVPATDRKYITVAVSPLADEIPDDRPPSFDRAPRPTRDDSPLGRLREALSFLPFLNAGPPK